MAWPSQLRAMTVTGSFCWYSAWCLVGAIVAYFFIPETRGLSLEELDVIFAMPMRVHGRNKLEQLQYWFRLRSTPPRDIQQIAREYFADMAMEVQSDEKGGISNTVHETRAEAVDTA